MMQPSGGGGFSPGMAMGIGSPYGPYGAPQPQQQPYAPYYMGVRSNFSDKLLTLLHY